MASSSLIPDEYPTYQHIEEIEYQNQADSRLMTSSPPTHDLYGRPTSHTVEILPFENEADSLSRTEELDPLLARQGSFNRRSDDCNWMQTAGPSHESPSPMRSPAIKAALRGEALLSSCEELTPLDSVSSTPSLSSHHGSSSSENNNDDENDEEMNARMPPGYGPETLPYTDVTIEISEVRSYSMRWRSPSVRISFTPSVPPKRKISFPGFGIFGWGRRASDDAGNGGENNRRRKSLAERVRPGLRRQNTMFFRNPFGRRGSKEEDVEVVEGIFGSPLERGV